MPPSEPGSSRCNLTDADRGQIQVAVATMRALGRDDEELAAAREAHRRLTTKINRLDGNKWRD